MQVRNVLVIGVLVGLGGYAVWDSMSADSQHARDLRDLEKLAPDVQVPACYPKHVRAKVFAEAVWTDARKPESLDSDVMRRGALQHDCIRGADSRMNVEKLADVLGDEAVPLYEEIIESCKVDKMDVSPSACFALDALGKTHSPKAVAVLEKVLASQAVAKEVALGALYRLLQAPSWKTRAQLAELVPAQKRWEAKDLIVEKIREVRDPAAKDALQRAADAEADAQEKGKLMAAILEIDNPGRCVVEDQGAGEDGNCRYVCKDQKLRMKYPKMGQTCPLVREAAPPEPAPATSSVGGVSGGKP